MTSINPQNTGMNSNFPNSKELQRQADEAKKNIDDQLLEVVSDIKQSRKITFGAKTFLPRNWDFLILVIIVIGTISASGWISVTTAESTAPTQQTEVNASSALQVDQHIGTNASTQPTNFTDNLLRYFVPVLLLLVAFVGGRRLATYDREIDNMRALFLEQIESIRNFVLVQSKSEALSQAGVVFEQKLVTYKEPIQKTLEEVKLKIETHKENAIKELQKLEQDLIKGQKDQLNDLQKLKESLKPYAWLHAGGYDQQVPEWEATTSVEAIHNRISSLFAAGDKENQNAAFAWSRNLMQRLDELQGDPDDYHNLAAEFARQELYKEAVQLLESGLQTYTDNVDILADLIKYSISTGQLEISEKYLQQLEQIDKSRWNWRAFAFVGDYLEISDPNRIQQLYTEMRERLPQDERSYSQEAGWHKRSGDLKKSAEIARQGIDNCASAAQCATLLADVELDLGNYQATIFACNRGIEGLAQEQPRANLNNLYFVRALAQDRLLHRAVQERQGEDWDEHSLAKLQRDFRRCVDDYQIAQQSGRYHRSRFDIEGGIRLQALRRLAREVFSDATIDTLIPEKAANETQQRWGEKSLFAKVSL